MENTKPTPVSEEVEIESKDTESNQSNVPKKKGRFSFYKISFVFI